MTQHREPSDTIKRSNESAQYLLRLLGRFEPEDVGRLGLSGLDSEILDLGSGMPERFLETLQEAIRALGERTARETEPYVKEDLQILTQAAELEAERVRLDFMCKIPYFDLTKRIYFGLRDLLYAQAGAERRAHALVRLRRYAGLEDGYTSAARLAVERLRERIPEKGLLAPLRNEVEKHLVNGPILMKGVADLLKQHDLPGHLPMLEHLQRELSDYLDFVRREVLPRARTDYRQPSEFYAYRLRDCGVDTPVQDLKDRASVAFKEIQNEMNALARGVAREHRLSSSDYRDVIVELKKKQLVGEHILDHYRQRIEDLEALIVENSILTLPRRKMKIRLANEAESAAKPVPSFRPPPLIGNVGEVGEFVIPVYIPGKTKKPVDDFTFEAAAWTLAAHEGRPGHDLQYSSMVERGVSIARAVFAVNSVNIEGWAVYAEAEVKPHLPLEGQLISLQHRLVRAARAVLDIGLHDGTVTPEQVLDMLRAQARLSETMCQQELERYMFQPCQATSYFCGYTRLMQLRSDVERILGSDFSRLRFHDFILSQGLVPPSLLRKTVLEEFVTKSRGSGESSTVLGEETEVERISR